MQLSCTFMFAAAISDRSQKTGCLSSQGSVNSRQVSLYYSTELLYANTKCVNSLHVNSLHVNSLHVNSHVNFTF